MSAQDSNGDEALRGKAIGNSTFFWPIFVIVGWGIVVVVNAWGVFYGSEGDEDGIRLEMERLKKQA